MVAERPAGVANNCARRAVTPNDSGTRFPVNHAEAGTCDDPVGAGSALTAQDSMNCLPAPAQRGAWTALGIVAAAYRDPATAEGKPLRNALMSGQRAASTIMARRADAS
jgi:hypothetical protein